MIHRIDRVNPDVDDRVIKPNEARDAVNLRFGASTEDTNLSGGTLILGNTEIDSFLPPSGTNRVVGVYSDLEARCVYFALYNGDTNHGLYRISGNTNAVEAILSGSWLNFQNGDDYNVSITAIDGKLYWTDNVNPPRMVNIEKGVRTQANPNGEDVYPVPVQDWHYTQIKRPPGEALLVSPVLTLDERSATIQNKTQTETGLQYSYYYVYDNFEESRLAPYTALNWATENVVVEIPNTEWNNYASVSSLIRAIVLVIRNGNDGVWRELQYQRNENGVRRWTFSNVLTAIKNTVSTDIVDARFDSVPLQSVTNEIAQNRVNHGNYVLDYEYDTSLKVEAKISYAGYARTDFNPYFESGDNRVYNQIIAQNINDWRYTSFVPWGRYAIGVEFVDKFGRTYPVINSVEVVSPVLNQVVRNLNPRQGWYGPESINFSYLGNEGDDVTVNAYEQGVRADLLDANIDTQLLNSNNTIGYYKITGLKNNVLPEWVDRVNIVRSKAKNIVTMNQSIGQIWLWYENEKQESRFFVTVNAKWLNYRVDFGPLDPLGLLARDLDLNTIWNSNDKNAKYTFKGYAIFFNNSEPFQNLGNQYVTIYQPYNLFGDYNPNNTSWANLPNEKDAGRYLNYVKFPVYSINNQFIFIKADAPILKHPATNLPISGGRVPDGVKLTPYSIPVAVNPKNVPNYNQGEYYYSLFYNFTLTTEINEDDQTVYTTQKTYTKAEFENEYAQWGSVKGYITGDANMSKVKKIYPNTTRPVNIYRVSGDSLPRITLDQPISRNRLEWYGTFISMSPRDIYAQQWNQDIGQVNVTDYKDVRNRRLNNSICFSLPIVQGTQVNGLNKFNSLDSRLAPAENGPITALVTTNATQREPGVMLAIGTYGISSFYYNAIQLTNVDGSENVTTTDAYLASQRPLLGQYGCSRPMSVTKTPLGTVYWWSDVVNDLIRYTNAGLERLGLTFSFGNFLRRTYNDNPLLITWYDQVTDEIILSGQGTNPALPLRAAVFSERYKTFQGQREYFEREKELLINYPERATGLPTKQYYFINGRIFVSDVEATGVDNNFLFGEYKNPALTIVTNEAPASVKQWNQIKVFGAKPTGVSLSCPSDSGSVPLVSSLSPQHFIERKGDYEAAIRRAENTTGGLLAGKIMESRIIYSTFAFDANTFVKLNFVEIKGNTSIVQ